MNHSPSGSLLLSKAIPGFINYKTAEGLALRTIASLYILECMAPDANAGDKTSVEHFDIHHSLKGIDKSPSVACVGITSNLQGKRADLLIPDDIESSKNSMTAVQRAQLAHLTLDFPSICSGRDEFPARTLWLGTPQSIDSIYNALPGRGVAVRIWPGRYSTKAQLENYGDHLAPLLVERMAADPRLTVGGGLLGDQGQPIDPSFLGEAKLQDKELRQGTAYFQLQHMLNTKLTDAMRYPLKLSRVVTMRLNESRLVPVELVPGHSREHLVNYNYGDFTFQVNTVAHTGGGYTKLPSLHMYVDPAPGGLNGDETGYAVSGSANGNIFVFDLGGIPGGYDLPKLEMLADIAVLWGVNVLHIEKNMGFGAFREVFVPILRKRHPQISIEDDLVSGQKELRILNTLEPIIGRGSLILNSDIIESDWRTAQRYSLQSQLSYSAMYQLAKLTRDRGSLLHDDRGDALEGTCRYWQATLQLDAAAARAVAERAAHKALTSDPLGYNRYRRPSLLNAHARRLRR